MAFDTSIGPRGHPDTGRISIANKFDADVERFDGPSANLGLPDQQRKDRRCSLSHAKGGVYQAPSTGYIGERLVSSVAIGSAVNIPTATFTTITTLNLTAGVWDVSAVVGFTGTPGTFLRSSGGISNNASAWGYPIGDGYVSTTQIPTTNNDTFVSVPAYRLVLASSQTIRLLATAAFSSSTLAGYGRISATRVG